MSLSEIRIDPADWPAAVADHEGPQLVVGGPGTGKTEFLVRRAEWLISDGGISPDRLLLLSFSRRGASDLRNRLEGRLDRSFTTIHASTFHSFAFRLLEAHGRSPDGSTPALLTGPEQVALVHDLLRAEDPAQWPIPFRSLLATSTFAREVTDFILRCREQLVDASRLGEMAAGHADWRGLPEFLQRYEAALSAQGRLDYGTLVERAVRLLDDPDVAAAVTGQFDFVLADEYQDTTAGQAQLLERVSRGNLTVAADPYQSIYSFRGAELENVARFPERFPDASGSPARRLVLTTSFRVPRAILDAAVRITAGGRLPGAAGPVTPAPGDGSVEAYGFLQQTEEAEWIAAEAQRLHLERGIPYRRMAVFVRSKRRFLPELSRSLERRRIPHDPPDSRLADHPAVRFVLDAVAAATDAGGDRTRAIRRMLLGPLFALPLGALHELERDRINARLSWPDAIQRFVPNGDGLASLLADGAWADRTPAVEGFWHLWERLPQIEAVITDPARSDERAAWSSLAQVLDRIHERDPEVTLARYRRLSEDEDFEARPLLSYRNPAADQFTLTTLHQSKGLEFDTVFIADAVEGVFPDLRARDSLLGARRLSATVPTDAAAYRAFRLQEEMRLAYTAMGRASRRVVWTATITGFDEGEGVPSRFLPLATGADAVDWAARRPQERTTPVTPLEAEAWLRRALRDPGAGAATRSAALDALGTGERWGLRCPTEFAGVTERGTDRGLIDPARLRLSPSQAESYATCPRRYALERRLHVGDEPSIYAGFGSMVHEVLQQAEAAALAAGKPHAELDEALEALDGLWEPAAFGEGSWAESWYRRAVAAITHLYSNWPSTGRPVALERDLELEIGGLPWLGRADRIEVDDAARLKIVDYKTSKQPMSKADAGASLQLGFYLLAVAADSELMVLGDPTDAEMWFPAKEAKSVITRRFDPMNQAGVVAALAAAADGIRSEAWPAIPNTYCDRCSVRLVCPIWPEGKEAFS